MNVYLSKEFSKFRKINNRYLKFEDKPEKQINISDNFNKFNKSNLTKFNNVYNSNFFSFNKIGNINNNISNYNNKKENNLKLNSLVNSSKMNNSNINLQLHITNIKNSSPKIITNKKANNEIKEENKLNNNLFKKDNEIPTLLKIQKLIEALQTSHTIDNKSTNLKNKFTFDVKKNDFINKRENNININKKNTKLPSLVNDIKTTFRPMKVENNEPKNFQVKDMINRINHTKIKLKNLNHDSHLVVKHSNKNREENSKTIQIKAKDLPNPKPKKPKITIDKVRNMIEGNLIINNNGSSEKIVNIRLKSDYKNARNFFNASIYQNNSLPQMKTKKDSVNFCISNYNNYKNNLMVLKQTFHNIESERARKEKFFNKNQTMFKNPLNEKKLKEENEDNDSEERDSKGFSKYFLPSSGFGLLQRHNN